MRELKVSDIFLKENLFIKDKYKFSCNIFTSDVVGISYYAAYLYKNYKQNIIILCPNLYNAQLIRDEIASIINDDDIIYIPSEELVAVEYVAASKEIQADRIFGIYKLITSNKPKIIILNVSCALRYFCDPNIFKKNIFKLKKDDVIDYEKFKQQLVEAGYIVTNKIEKTGDVSFRGSIIDIFPINLNNPIRIDLFDDQIEKIKYFDVSNQTSFEEIDEVEFCPNSDFLIEKDMLLKNIERLKKLTIEESKTKKNPNVFIENINSDLDELENFSFSQKDYKYFKLLSEKVFSIFSYINDGILLYSNDEQIEISKESLLQDAEKFKNDLINKDECLNYVSLFYDDFDYNYQKVCKNRLFSNVNYQEIKVRNPNLKGIDKSVVINFLKLSLSENYKIYLCFDYKQQKDFFITTFLSDDNKEILNNINFVVDELKAGFDFYDDKVMILSPKEIFNYKTNTSRYISRFKEATIIKNYEDLNIGDYVVHEKYGIAKYNGIETIKSGENTNDYIKLIFDKGDALFIPLEQFKIIRKYISKEGYVPKLSKLFSSKWETAKNKVKEDVAELAIKLLNLYSDRLNIKRKPYLPDDEFQISFEKQFPYKLTNDQIIAIKDVKNDMEKDVPMNRLICGDVAFGKTEIAFIAAFKVINSGRQVVMLCPTTLLAKQHYERAVERFNGFDVKIALFTRFTTNKQISEDINEIKEGKVHFVIGTHKALNKKIIYKDLGLLIIDEEQRFGVEQKEKIKIANKDVDVLTLSATPIPRTLQLSLAGMRSISLITTAPINRAPIQTFLIEYNERFIVEVISRELGRRGQTFYLYNDVITMPEKINKLRSSLPNARIEGVHGQMDKMLIDEIMNDFYNGNIDVLVTTTIIENGIDVSNANLIIVENADKFGLAQLYQIKGRVGRSNTLAYAYLTYRGNKNLTSDAKKRLKTIKEFTELGSGYKIAQRDLMIRGAGDILGKDQSGNINEVGIDLYLKLLNQEINKVKNNTNYEEEQKIDFAKISISGYIPNNYANDTNKIEIYNLVDNSNSIDELNKAIKKITDIYGAIPEEFVNLIKIRQLKIKLKNPLFLDFKEEGDYIVIVLNKEFSQIDGIGYKLFSLLISYKEKIKINFERGSIKIILYKKYKDWFLSLNNLVDTLLKLYNDVYENR